MDLVLVNVQSSELFVTNAFLGLPCFGTYINLRSATEIKSMNARFFDSSFVGSRQITTYRRHQATSPILQSGSRVSLLHITSLSDHLLPGKTMALICL